MKPILLGIAGASGSGKSTLAHALEISDSTPDTCVLSMDHYYHGLPDGVTPQEYNFDHPSAMDLDQLCADLAGLKAGKHVSIPQYDFTTHKRCVEGVPFSPAPLIIVEGIILYVSEPLRDLFDCRIFLDVPDDLCLQRRIVRDMADRGRTEDDIRQQVANQVEPMFHQFVLPTITYADLTLAPPNLTVPAFDEEISSLWKEITGIFQPLGS
jgi:uridine kinase